MTAPTITWPNDTGDVVDAIRDAIGRDITIYVTVSGIPCTVSGCSLDPVTNLSTNQFCPVCGGNYWINTVSGLTVNAHVRLRTVDIPIWTVGGEIVEGDAQVQIKYTATNLNAVDNAKYFLVDNKKFIKENISIRGAPAPNRIVVTLEEQEG